jgi:hypothetical protein
MLEGRRSHDEYGGIEYGGLPALRRLQRWVLKLAVLWPGDVLGITVSSQMMSAAACLKRMFPHNGPMSSSSGRTHRLLRSRFSATELNDFVMLTTGTVEFSRRWEFEALSPTLTRLTETFEYRDTGPIKDALKYYERLGFAKDDAKGIEATLIKLASKYPS